MGFVSPHFKNSLGADFGAQTTPDTFFRVEHQGGYIIKVS
jgi:hypothetical protein